MKLKISHYIHYLTNLQIAAETARDYYYHLRPIEYRVTTYKRRYDDYTDDQIKCFPLYKNTSILFSDWPIINVI